ncbi:MAG: PHP domain-containing protein [Nanoarchaeota archaeon]|nr:PHP domain-containing protein [Nanoarchaeota archaeon]
MLKVDLHNHSNYIQPWETNYSPKELIDEAVKQGYDAICFSEHYAFTKIGDLLKEYRKDPFASYKDFKEYASKKSLLLIPAIEIKYKEGEVLLINFKGNVKDYPTIESLKNLSENVLVVAPHPFFKRGFCLGKDLIANIDLFDAIEYSHFYIKSCNLNEEAVELAKKYNKVLLGTSDAHRLEQLGYTYSLVDAKKDADSIVKAIKLGKVKLVTSPLPIYIFVKTTVRSIYHFVKAVPLILYRWIKFW